MICFILSHLRHPRLDDYNQSSSLGAVGALVKDISNQFAYIWRNKLDPVLTVVVMLRIKIHCMACLTSLMLFLFFISNNVFAVQYPLNKRQHSQGKSHWLLSISATHFKIYAQRDEVPGVRASNNKIIALTPFD